MRSRLHNMHLGRQLTIIACIIVLIPMLISSWLLYRDAIMAFSEISLRAGKMSVIHVTDLISSRYQQMIKLSESIASNRRLLELIQKAQNDYPPKERIDDIRELRELLTAYESDSAMISVRLVYPVEVSWISNNRSIAITLDEFHALLAQNDIFMKNEMLPGPVWLPNSGLSSATALFTHQTITYARMVRNISDFDQLLGYILIMQNRSQYESLLQKADITGDSLVVLLDEHERVMARGGGYDQADALWQLYSEQNKPVTQIKTAEGLVQVLEHTFNDTGWRFILLLPQSEYRQSVLGATWRMIWLVILLTGVAIFFAALVYRVILSRINRIVCSMERVQQGNMSAFLQVNGSDELGQIEKNYNLMLERINSLIDETHKLSERERLQRIRLLQTQINPHFLYNTLNSIIWIAMDYKAEKVCQMIKALSDFYKIGLQPGQEETTCEQELLHAERFVALQNLRNDQQIILLIEIDESLRSCLVPNMMLQPLVENSIIHGFEGRNHGKIKIQAYTRDGIFCLDVSDDGHGMLQSDCDQLLQQQLPGHAYGIYSIRERLKLRYGAKADLQLYAKTNNEGLLVSIQIPILLTSDHS